jgi:uncharacterized OB-fold protein
MPRLEPKASKLTEPFWEATRARRLVLQWCRRCDANIHYPRWACPSCLGDDLEWRESAGRGSLYSFSIATASASPMLADLAPVAIALVELDEGVRLVSNVVEVDLDAIEVGMAVRVRWEPMTDGRHFPLFAADRD